jgi:hypothetical protein|tara:strand:- start:376 stop:756 length:381 start_codon:yes stop_codon:yes gene_type:complete
MKTTFKIKKVLNKDDTNKAYTLIRKASYHLANECSNSPSSPSKECARLYSRIMRYLNSQFIAYDKDKQLATPIGNFETVEKYLSVSRIPKALLTALETSKSPTKKDLESKIAELENKLNSNSKKRV